jgi:hypothetical protein
METPSTAAVEVENAILRDEVAAKRNAMMDCLVDML